jgi:hypothetical protein
VLGLLASGAAVRETTAAGRTFQIGLVDFYGLDKVAVADVRSALTFTEGDRVEIGDGTLPAEFTASESRVAHLRGVEEARVEPVCCEEGRLVVYVGVQERGAPALKLRRAPHGGERLAPEVLRAGREFSQDYLAAVQRGDAAEDLSQGHALAHDPATRSVEEEFLAFATRDLSDLRAVLRGSSEAGHRALAAQILGYAKDPQGVVDDLVYAMSDPDEVVRNNAMRALTVFADEASGAGAARPRVPAEPFVGMLHSLVWSDRNKASAALLALSAARDPDLLAALRRSAVAPLVEMTRWKSADHAYPAFLILARVAGYDDGAAGALWRSGDTDVVIQAAARPH